MNPDPKTSNPIKPLGFTPEITVWHARISDIIQAVYGKNTYHNYQPMVNEIFQKDDFATPFLNSSELAQLNTFRSLKKQMEWSCGRYLLKQVLHHHFLNQTQLEDITISYEELGAPKVDNHDTIKISLSHSNDYTIAAATCTPDLFMGIDLEKINAMPDDAFLNTAFTPDEITTFNNDPKMVFKAWTLKEAFLKYLKLGFNESLKHVEVINDQIFHNKQKADVKTGSIFFGQYVASMVYGQPASLCS